MKQITGFRLRKSPREKNKPAEPKAYQDAAALGRLLEKICAMGEAFFAMPEEMYGDWLNSLPRDEFIELIALE